MATHMFTPSSSGGDTITAHLPDRQRTSEGRAAQDARPRGCPITAARSALAQPSGLLARIGIFLYGVLAYAAFFFTICYAIGFVGNWIVPKSIDSGVVHSPVTALTINAALLALFVVQHTIMARRGFKRWFTKIIPASMERSTFVLLASGCLLLLFWQWRPVPDVLWNVEAGWARGALSALSLSGWGIVFLASFMVSHFDLFGLRQVWTQLIKRTPQPISFRLVGLYRVVRHPLMLGFLIAFWATPTMTVGHLFFAIMTTAYIIMGVAIEERDLVHEFGDRYRSYRKQVPAIIPVPGRFARRDHA